MLQQLILPQTLHLWVLCPEKLSAATQQEAQRLGSAWLTPAEQSRQMRLYSAENQQRFLLTRLMVRQLLSWYAPVAPADWVFAANRYGRPYATNPEGAHVVFNLSHTDGCIVCLIGSQEATLGVDVERLDRDVNLEVASRYFSPQETADLQALPASQQKGGFLTYWTLKEAYIKARGMGLALSLSSFSFKVAPPDPVAIHFAPELMDNGDAWQFIQLQPTPDHLVAVGAKRGVGTANWPILIQSFDFFS